MLKIIKKLVFNILMTIQKLHFKSSKEVIMKDNKWLLDISNYYLKMQRIFNNYFVRFQPYPFVKTIIEISKNEEEKDELLKRLVDYFKISNNNAKKMLFWIFFTCNLFDNETCKQIVKYLDESDTIDDIYWTVQDISKLTFRLQKGIYPDFFNDRKKLIKKIAEGSNFVIPVKKPPNNKKTLCIITAMLDSSIKNSTQRVAMMFANGLKDDFDAIKVVSLEIFSSTKEDQKNGGTIFYKGSSMDDIDKIRNLFNKNIDVYCAQGKNYKDKFQNALNEIYEYNPNAILDMSDEYSIISYFYSKDFPTFYVRMRDRGTSSFYSKIFGRRANTGFTNSIYNNNIDESKVVDWCFPEYVPEKKNIFTREKLNISNDKFVIITIGNNRHTITNELVDVMGCILKNNNFVWLLVGDKGPEYLHKQFGELISNRKIIEWGYEDNLRDLCSCCDVLVRANTTGGSGATAIAAMEGLPIVMTNKQCDPMRWLGNTYSNLQSYKEMGDEIIKLYNDKTYYGEKSQEVQSKVSSVMDSRIFWSKLAEILMEA